MKHLGDITKIHGCIVPITDVVIGGSPCQDLSVAGKRAGLAGARSGLFMEQIRIVKEMRYADQCSGRTGQFIRPRYMVWENVPGAFSSNKGEDFRAVLEEICRVADETTVVPQPPNGKWANAGCIMGNGWSIAWRVLDAQFWGVPQRRRRISLVADFGGQSAPEILFERKGVCGNPPQSGEAGQGTAGDAESRVDSAECYGICSYASNSMKSDNPHSGIYKANTARTLDLNGGNPACNQGGIMVLDARGNGDGNISPMLTGDHQDRITDYTALAVGAYCCEDIPHMSPSKELSPCLSARGYKSQHYVNDIAAVTYPGASITSKQTVSATFGMGGGNTPLVSQEPDSFCIAGNIIDRQVKNGGNGLGCQATYQQTVGTIGYTDHKGVNNQFVSEDKCIVERTGLIRRLTPLECERLQGFPDGWTDIGAWTDSKGKLHKESSDSARYKALGNSIALPPWKWVLKRLCACYERDASMASLFDGIGGFPLIWEQLNGKGTCLWASEIEEFPIAVTKFHFGEASR